MVAVRQTSFAGGELSPTLYGRSDLSKYGVGLRRCRNFFISHHGAAVSRPGTIFICEVKDSSKRVRLIHFVYSDSVSYVLEFGDLYIRFISDGVQVESSAVPYEIVSPYTEADLPRLKFAQIGDVLTITHPSYTPRDLTRLDHASWTLTTIAFDRALAEATPVLLHTLPVADATHPALEWQWQVTDVRRDSRGVVTESAPRTITQVALDYYLPYSATFIYALGTIVAGTGAEAGNNYRSLQAANLNHPLSDAAWWVIDNTGVTPTPVQLDSVPSTVVVYLDKPVTIRIRSSYGLASSDPNFIAYRVYRGQGGTFGWIGDTKATTFTDIGEAPDYSRAPPQGRDPFKVYAADGTLTRTEEPTAVTFFEQRCVFAGTAERPEYVFASRTNDFANFDNRLIPVADEAVEFELASRKREEVRAILGLDRLIIFTNSSVWAAGGAGGAPLASTELIEARVQSEIGSNWLDPLAIGDSALFVRAKGSGVRDLFFQNERQSFTGGDLSLLAQHLFTGFTVVDWAYAEDPWSLVWAVRDDGKMLSLTYAKEEQMWAWAWHDTNGTIENVCAVPETDEDGVYVVVNRVRDGVNKRYIERMASRVIPLNEDDEPDVTQAICLDSSLTYDGPPVTAVTGLDHLEGEEVYALADGVPVGPLTVVSGSVSIADDMPDGAQLIHVGLKYTPELETLDLAEGRTRQKTVSRVGVEVETSRGLHVGETFDELTEWRQRNVSASYDEIALQTTTAEVTIRNTWNKGARVCLRQDAPLPLTVFGITREVERGG